MVVSNGHSLAREMAQRHPVEHMAHQKYHALAATAELCFLDKELLEVALAECSGGDAVMSWPLSLFRCSSSRLPIDQGRLCQTPSTQPHGRSWRRRFRLGKGIVQQLEIVRVDEIRLPRTRSYRRFMSAVSADRAVAVWTVLLEIDVEVAITVAVARAAQDQLLRVAVENHYGIMVTSGKKLAGAHIISFWASF